MGHFEPFPVQPRSPAVPDDRGCGESEVVHTSAQWLVTKAFNIPTLYRREQNGGPNVGCRKGDGPLNILGEGWLLGDGDMRTGCVYQQELFHGS